MILTLSHQKGGVGKSTIAWNLAVLFSKIIPTKIIDLDTQQTLSVTNDIRQSVGLEALSIIKIESADALAHYIENDKDDELTIIDSGGFDSAYNRLAIIGSDMLVTPVSDKPFDLMGLQKYEEILSSLSEIQGETIQSNIVLNNLNPAMKKYGDIVDYLCQSDYFELLTSVLKQRVDVAHSVGDGKSVKEYRRFSKADQEFDMLFEEIKEKLNIL